MSTSFRSIPHPRRLVQAVAALGFSVAAFGAWAQAPLSSLSLTFVDPTETVSATAAVSVVVQFTNNDASQAFTFDPSLPDFGLDASLLPTEGQYTVDGGDPVNAPFATYTGAYLTIGAGCSGTFFGSCGDEPYHFDFGDNPFDGATYTLDAGQSVQFTLGTFTPTGGSVAPGIYEFYRGVIGIAVFGTDADGHDLSTLNFPIATCSYDTAADCSDRTIFTRTVEASPTAVPEPGSWATMGVALAAMGLVARRRRDAQSA